MARFGGHGALTVVAPHLETGFRMSAGGHVSWFADNTVMSDSATPRPYEQWRTVPDRAEDAAYTFGYYLMQHCRTEALKQVRSATLTGAPEDFQTQAEAAVDVALHNVMDLLEGFWRTQTGPNHTAEFALSVCVRDASRTVVERIDISPCLLDLPIGIWKWKGGEFR